MTKKLGHPEVASMSGGVLAQKSDSSAPPSTSASDPKVGGFAWASRLAEFLHDFNRLLRNMF